MIRVTENQPLQFGDCITIEELVVTLCARVYGHGDNGWRQTAEMALLVGAFEDDAAGDDDSYPYPMSIACAKRAGLDITEAEAEVLASELEKNRAVAYIANVIWHVVFGNATFIDRDIHKEVAE